MNHGGRENRLVLGLTGPVGSGVTTVARAIGRLGFADVSLSAAIKSKLREKEALAADDPLDEVSVPGFRQKLQDIGNEGRQASSAHWVDEALHGAPQDRELVIDGVRNMGEVSCLRDRFSRFFLVAVYAPPQSRWNRVKEAYNKNYGAFERDDARDSNENIPWGQQVALCVQHADYVFVNDGDGASAEARLQHLAEALEADVALMRAAHDAHGPPGFKRPPTPAEVHMATAFAQSQMSRCLKRHVGAVIVSEQNLPLSLGYNENPVGMKPCVAEFKHCHKDELMHKKLEVRQGKHCPTCGVKMDNLERPWICAECGEDLKALFFPSRNMELCTAIHAEERAIRSLGGRSSEGCALYTTTFPCFQCARYIIDAGIKRVVYVEAYPVEESQDYLLRNNVMVEPFQGFKARAFNLVFKQVD